MSLKRLPVIVVFAWLALVAASISARVSFEPAVGAAEALGWLLLAVLPSTVALLVFRGAPPPTVAEVLFDAERREAPSRAKRSTR